MFRQRGLVSCTKKPFDTTHPPPCNCKLTPSLYRGDCCHFLIILDSRSRNSLQNALASKTNSRKCAFLFQIQKTSCKSFLVKINVRKEIFVTSFEQRPSRYFHHWSNNQFVFRETAPQWAHHSLALTIRHRASCILGQAFHYSPENAFYIFNQQIYFITWYLFDRASLI